VNQKASLGFLDRSVLDMNQRTDLMLKSANLTAVRRGEVAVTVTPGTQFRIQTANAIAAAVGTKFDVRIARASSSSPYGGTPGPVLPPGTTTVSVVKGAVSVANGFGSVRVLPGFWTHVRPGQAPTQPTRHNAAADFQWTNGLP
jgi:ferric-dicitrate binding protein FerR (iron transport regulator)